MCYFVELQLQPNLNKSFCELQTLSVLSFWKSKPRVRILHLASVPVPVLKRRKCMINTFKDTGKVRPSGDVKNKRQEKEYLNDLVCNMINTDGNNLEKFRWSTRI